ncbi:MAG: glutathione S-transferase C-terminal domain-containing protein, partial [Chloroflexota bacterium]
HFYAYAPYKMEYPINRFTMETKRQMDLLDRQLADNQFISGDAYTIADMAIWPWYSNLVNGSAYNNAAEFLDAGIYKNLNRWVEEIGAREAVNRGKRVNRGGDDYLRERHDASDFDQLSL